MKANYFLIVLLIGVFYNSCKKEVEDEYLSESFTPSRVYAGVSDTSLFNYTFVNPVSVEVIYDVDHLFGYGSSIIDFDLNGVNELSIIMNVINQDSIHLLNGSLPVPSPSCSIETSLSLSIAMINEDVIINGYPSNYQWCDAISTGQEVGSNLEWSDVNSELDLWCQINGNNLGEWFSIGGVSYIGFKLNDKYGWLEVDVTNPLNPIFTKLAMQR